MRIKSYFQIEQSAILRMLNTDCLLELLERLPPPELINIIRVCKKLNYLSKKVIRTHYTKWEFSHVNPVLNKKQIKTLFIEYGHMLENITIIASQHKCQYHEIEKLTFRLMNKHTALRLTKTT